MYTYTYRTTPAQPKNCSLLYHCIKFKQTKSVSFNYSKPYSTWHAIPCLQKRRQFTPPIIVNVTRIVSHQQCHYPKRLKFTFITVVIFITCVLGPLFSRTLFLRNIRIIFLLYFCNIWSISVIFVRDIIRKRY